MSIRQEWIENNPEYKLKPYTKNIHKKIIRKSLKLLETVPKVLTEDESYEIENKIAKMFNEKLWDNGDPDFFEDEIDGRNISQNMYDMVSTYVDNATESMGIKQNF